MTEKEEENVKFSRFAKKDNSNAVRNYGTSSEDADGLELVDPSSPVALIERDKTPRRTMVDGSDSQECELSAVFDKQWRQYYHYRLLLTHGLLLFYFVSYTSTYAILEREEVSAGLLVPPALFCLYCLAAIATSVCSPIGRRRSFQTVISLITASLTPVIIWIRTFTAKQKIQLFHGLPAIITCSTVIYCCLKSPRRFDIIWCAAISIAHLFFIRYIPGSFADHRVPEILAVVLALSAANILGCFHSYYLRSCRRGAYERFNDAVEKRTIVEYEKERQEQLLLSIIPVYLAAKVRKTILNRTSKTRESIDYGSEQPKMFQDLHVQQHDNVSILFADIVNFTPLTAELTAAELVRFLNELYSRFDNLAQDYQCMRIKILGDCYYCVSGMPVSRPNHADNCVKMGLAMIDAIKVLREAASVNMDMRIGIHSGSVLCGLLGLKKWQYDIWSDDVTLANKMESGGSPGKLHITKATMQLLSGFYKIVPSTSTDPYFQSHGIETYFIVPSSNRVVSTHSAYELKSVTNGSVDSRNDLGKFEDIRTKSFSNRNRLGTVNTMCKATSKMSKMVEFWGAESPFSNLSRRRSSDHIRSASINLIANSFDAQDWRRLKGCCCAEPASSDFDVILRHKDKAVESNFWFSSPVTSNVVISVAVIASMFLASIGLTVNKSVLQLTVSGIGLVILILLLILVLAQFVKENLRSTVASRIVIMEKFRLSNGLISCVVLATAVCLAVAPFVIIFVLLSERGSAM